MIPSALHSRPARAVGGLCLGVVALAGCSDSGSDPLAVLVAVETHGALAVAEDLPSLPELTRRIGSEQTLSGATDLWTGSWQRGEEGQRLRMDAYMEAVPRLVTELGADGIRAALAPVRSTVLAAETIDPNDLPAFVLDGMARSRALADEAEQALAGADLGRALLLTLEASDMLRALGPEEVARDLVARAEYAMGRNGDVRTYSDLELERSRHLLLSAGEAMGRKDYLRAIRRAFYACQLLGVEVR